MLRLLLLVALSSNLAACSSLLLDPRDSPWDPKKGATLMDQIPAWDGAANRVCGGHLPEEQRIREGRSARC
jgi:hypothetical protein